MRRDQRRGVHAASWSHSNFRRFATRFYGADAAVRPVFPSPFRRRTLPTIDVLVHSQHALRGVRGYGCQMRFCVAFAALVCVVGAADRRARAERDRRHGEGHVRRGAAGRDRRSRRATVLIEKTEVGVDRRRRRVQDRRSAARHLRRHVHAAGLQHRQARRARAAVELHGDDQRRPEGRRARGIGDRLRRVAGRRRAEQPEDAGAVARRARRGADRARPFRASASWSSA